MIGRKRAILSGAAEPRVSTRARIRVVWKGAGHMRGQFGPHRPGCSKVWVDDEVARTRRC
jgi:hypothetical protein